MRALNASKVRTMANRLKACFGLLLLCGLVGSAFIEGSMAETGVGAEVGLGRVNEGWLEAAPLPFEEIRRDEVKRTGRRTGVNIIIVPAADQSRVTQAEIVCTILQAAIKCQLETKLPVIYATFVLPKPEGVEEEAQLAVATYIPDGKGYSGDEDLGPWENVMAVKRGFTDQEIRFINLRAQLRAKRQDDANLTEEALNAETELAMDIAPGTLNPDSNEMEYVDLTNAPEPTVAGGVTAASHNATQPGLRGGEAFVKAMKNNGAEFVSRVKARIEKRGGKLRGEFEFSEMKSVAPDDYIFADFRMYEKASSPDDVEKAKEDARIVAGFMVEELRAMGVKVGNGGAVTVLRLYDLIKDGAGKNTRRIFGVMSCGPTFDGILWEGADSE